MNNRKKLIRSPCPTKIRYNLKRFLLFIRTFERLREQINTACYSDDKKQRYKK